ncbi:MAG TPA: nucleotide exchange factor GrpE [Myxococcota bacterium]|nr:nucleotide exchange factor GrpE [Myxococcota bacterium]HRY93194.1 nucleotide exchange factor GrpE [Myxococcota bacterium]
MGREDKKGFEVQIPADLAEDLCGVSPHAPGPADEETVVAVEVGSPPPAGAGDGPAADGAPADAGRLRALQEELDQARAAATEAKERMLRVAADADNIRKRAQREKQEALKYGLEGIAKDLLPIVDNLDRTLAHVPKDSADQALAALREGVEMVLRQFLDSLARHQVVAFGAQGQPFDPARHEAISQKESRDVPPGTVVEELHRGFMLSDRLLRPALVVVAKAPAETQAGPGADGDEGAAGEGPASD